MATATTLLSSEWLTLEETCKRLGKSVSTIERLAANRTIASKIEPVPGRKGMRVYKASDVERLAHEHTAHLVPASSRPPQSVQLALPDEILALARAICTEREQRLLPAPETRTDNQAVVPIDKKLWLSLDEAVAYSGLARADLLELCRRSGELQSKASLSDGENLPAPPLNVRKSGGWKIQRASLEAFQG